MSFGMSMRGKVDADSMVMSSNLASIIETGSK